METFAGYLFRSMIWLTGFALVFSLFLRNERFFLLKRYYLLAGIIFSFLFPLISVHYQVEIPAAGPVPAVFADEDNRGSLLVQQVNAENTVDFREILLYLYIAGVLFFAFSLVMQIRMLIKRIRKADIVNNGRFKLVRSSEFSSSFSFFNYVFINPSENGDEEGEIINHEFVHVTQKHWFDLLLMEILRLLQWANPFAWIYTGFIRLNHEYLADEAALQRSSDPAIYKAALMNQLFGTQVFSLTNSFNYSLNRKRFEMMKKTITSPYRKLKVLFVLPVIAIVFYAFAKPEYHYLPPADNRVISIPDGLETEELSGTVFKETDNASIVQEKRISKTDQESPRPLLLIDGKESNTKLSDLNPDDIKTISVLKDKSATAVFGEKGKDGVIIVITRNEPNLSVAQVSKTIKGIVVNEQGKPLAGVNIVCTGPVGHASGASTGADGHFTISNVLEDASLLFSFKGYKRLSLKADFTSEMTVKMVKDPEYKEPAVQANRPKPLIIVDGVISEAYPPSDEVGIVKTITEKDAVAKYGEKGRGGVIEITTRKRAAELGIKVPFRRRNPEDFPTFRGGKYTTFRNWVLGQLKYPPEAQVKNIEGWVQVNYTIEGDGTVTNIKTVGIIDPILSDAVVNIIKSSPKWEPAVNPEAKDPFQSGLTLRFRLPDQIGGDEPFVVVEKMPMYPGGDGELLKFIRENTKYPAEAKRDSIQGRVIVRFIVNTLGSTEGCSVLKGVHPLLDAEAIRVVSLLSGFTPGSQGGKPVNVWYMVPITFALK
jgi:TonB family protein